MKQFIVTIGYDEYAVSGEDALALMRIAARAKKLSRANWNSPREYAEKQEPFITAAALEEIEPPTKDASPKQDAFTAATRDVAGS